ncbi:uncharacterized protein LOC132637629 [Lycium barbarum]|uniref:uncharacterized protein LOC132637629 n=1 Tax=Lycium barbarum TaxID=112863 RepID=UPI00293EE843|nr:uncharacterized protein LOC132637629 [Lycium barbarum]
MREAIQLLTQLVVAQAQRQGSGHGDRAVSARVHDFINLDHPEFFGSKPKEDPQNFIDEMLRTLQEGMDISRIQAHAQNLEKRQQQRRSEREHDRGYRKRARFSDTVSEFRGAQSSRALNSQINSGSSQMRPPLTWCTQCGRLHWGQCRSGSDICYAYSQPGYFMRDCPSRVGRGMVQPTRSATDSSSSVRPPGKSSQTPAGFGRGKAKVVVDALSRRSMDSLCDVQPEKRELARELQ